MTIVEPTRAETVAAQAPTDAQRAALAAGDRYVDLYLELSGPLDAERLRTAIDTAVAEFPQLHSTFDEHEGQLRVREHPAAVPSVEVTDPGQDIAEWIERERARPMDVARGPLHRQAVFRYPDGRLGWYQRYHRLVNDHPGALLVLARVRDLLGGTPGATTPVESRAERLENERRYRESGTWSADRDHWEHALAEAARPEPLATDLAEPADGAVWTTIESSAELTRIARACGGGAPAVLLAALAVYTSRTALAGECVIALDTGETAVPLRIPITAQVNFVTVAKQVGRELRKARRHRFIPDIDEPWADSPVHGQWPLAVRMLGGAAIETLGSASVTERFAHGDGFTVCVDDQAVGGWRIAVGGVHRSHRDRLIRLLGELARAPHTPLARIDLAAPEEIECLLGVPPADTVLPSTTLVDLLAEQAARSPAASALVGHGTRMTYAELHAAANRLARMLIELGVGPETLVALAFDSSFEQVVAVHAVLAAGGAYLALDLEHPRSRHALVVEIARPLLVLTTRRDGFDAPEGIRVIHLEDLDTAAASAAPVTDADRRAPLRPENLAYISFTSGSTGQPKGVAIVHATACVHLAWMQHLHGLDETDAVVRKTTLTFDLALWEVLWPLTVGARLVIEGLGPHGDPNELARVLAEHRVTTVQFTPSTLAAHRQAVPAPMAASVRRVLLCGEQITPALAAALPGIAPGAVFDNFYGPTEVTVVVTRHPVGADSPRRVPIGAPGWHVRTHVLDACLRPVAAGLPGELYLGGPMLGRGYAGQPGLTATRFVADPFGEPGRRLYRTGDLVRSTGHGELEYLGRTDFQVKLRGVRIELGELESVLAAQESVAQAVAVVHAGGGGRLIAYAAPAAGHRIDPGALEQRLRTLLPRHLVPAAIIALPALPMTRTGKVDRNALPAPDVETGVFRAPRSDAEIALAAAYSEVLGRDAVGVDDSFFALGGDSIMSILLVSRARAHGITVTAQQVFEHRTVARLAAVAETDGGQEIPMLAELPGGGTGDLPLTPIVRFLVERGGEFDRFCQSMTLHLPVGIDRGALVSTLTAVIDHHDMLRSRLGRDVEGDWCLQVAPPGSIDVDALIHQVRYAAELPAADLRTLAEAELNAAVDRIDPATGAVLRFVWLTPDSGTAPGLLVIAAHHIAVDGVSWRILLPDFIAAWAAVASGATPRLPAAATSMRRWAHALAEAAHSDALTAELPLWREIVEGPAPAFGDRAFDPRRDLAADIAHTSVELGADETAALLTLLPQRYRIGVADALLTALALAVTRWRSWRGETERSVLLRLEGHGREQDAVPGAELSRTVGWFTSLVPARLDLTGVDLDDAFDGGPAMALALKAVKEQVRVTPRHGFGYGLLRYLNADTAAALAPHEPGEISFNYFGHITGLDIPTELTGLGFLPSTEFGMPAIRPDARRGALGAVEVDSIVLGGRLVTGFGYVRGLFGTAAGEELVELWRSALDAVVRHARTPDTGGGHTPSDFPLATVAQRDIDGWEQRYPALTDVWPATPLQAGMMFHALFDPDAVDVYTIQLVVDLHDTVDTARLRSAADAALARHANLRTAFEVTAAGAPVQIVSAAAVLPWRELELPAATGADVRTLEAERLLPFDLTAPPLLRFLLLRLDDGRTRFAVTCHHLLLDGWSIPLLLREIMAEYAGLTIEPPPPYRRYLEWLARQDDSRSRPVWAETLAGITAPMLLADTVSVHAPTGVPRERAFDLDPAQTRALTRLAAEHEVTMNTVVQAAWAILLARTTDRDDVLFGTTVSGRPAELAGVENIVGLFINTIPVRVRLVPGESVGALLRRVQREQFALRAHHHLGLPDIIAQSGIGEPNLFDTLVVVETYPVDEAALRSDARAYAGLTIGDVRSAEATHYALTLTVRLTDRLHIMAGWWPELFDEQTVSRLGERLTRVLMELAANPNTVAAEIDPAGAVERDRMLEWQRPAAPTTEMTLVELFRTQAARQAEAVAVRYGDRTLTYRDLDERSDDLAHVLVASGARPESLVAVAVSRSTELIVALLAVLKSGGAYVPLDLGSPPQRLEFILGETKPACVLTTAADRAALPGDHYPVLILDDIGLTGKTELVAPVPDPDNLAYVLYTSGSTGRPKGVSVTHRNVVDLLAATRTLIDTDHADVWTMFHSPAFDVSVWEMWGSLLSGGTLVIVDAELTRSPQEFTELLVREGITVLCQTPSAFGALLDTGLRPAAVPALRHLVLAGEALQSRGLHGWFDADAGQARLWNLYGITEATVYSTHFAVDRAYADSARSSVIGRGLPGTTVRVLDSRLRPSPIGVRGEVYLTGTQLARGYHARPATSAERYVADPSGGPGERMLRTGDLARWTENGQLEYLGRGDQQVKIRGYRIEPGEVEAALLEHDSVTRAIVVARAAASGSTRLIAYVIPAGALEVEALETHLAQRLPAYLRPAAIMVVDTLPLTANGKLDVAALPDPVVSPRSDRAPHTTAEHLVADLFAEVLGIDRPGLDDSFFTLGGDSIISIQLSARARALGLRFTPREVFEHRTVAGIARVARTSDAGDGHGALPELPGGGVGELPLLPVARWLTERGGGFRRFTQTLTVELPADTSAHALITAVSAVIERHDMLRGRLFRDDSGSWRFDVAPALDASALVHATTFDDTADPDALRALVAAETDAALDRLDPAAGVMAQFVRLTAERGTVPDRLIIAVHHLAVDGVSWRILLPDLHAALAMDAKGAVPQLDPVATSMRRWAHGLLEAAHTRPGRRTRILAAGVRDTGSAAGLPPTGSRRRHRCGAGGGRGRCGRCHHRDAAAPGHRALPHRRRRDPHRRTCSRARCVARPAGSARPGHAAAAGGPRA